MIVGLEMDQSKSESTPKGQLRISLETLRQGIIVLLSAIGLFLIVDRVFYLGILGPLEVDNSYNYFLMSIFLSLVFIISPSKKGITQKRSVFFWVDWFCFFIMMGVCFYFGLNGYDILMKGWGASAPKHMIILSIILWAAILETTRRTGGLVLAIIVTIISLYPLIAEGMPGLLKGAGFSFNSTVAYHIMSPDSALGIPIRVVGELLAGYLVFGIVLVATGGGDFFIKLAMTLLGNFRGGIAKVAILSSAFFGTLSGSAVANVVTTGSITIPMMKKAGYEPHFAGAVEACASNGGQLMPPVMGAVAFVMAAMLNISYFEVALGAAVPALLYYFGIFIQVDGRAVYKGLRGVPRAEIPSLKKTLKEGWFYLVSLVILIIFLYYRMEAQAPFYASVWLLFVGNIRRQTRFTPMKLKRSFNDLAEMLCQLVPLLAAIGMIIGSLAMTGIAHALPSELLHLSGNNLNFLLFLTAVSCFILGMGMTAIAVYIFTAVIMAPPLVELGLNEFAVHMFLLYNGILAFITPPVCIAVYPAAAIAGTNFMKVGWAAVRLGAVLFFIPFLFVVEPALLLRGPFIHVIYTVGTAFTGVFLLASSIEGYLIGVGILKAEKGAGLFRTSLCYVLRAGLLIGGFLITMPGWRTDLIGALIAIFVLSIQIVLNRSLKRAGLFAKKELLIPPSEFKT
jgi:TRAP transporter 4TM/12TM fusion protein